MLLEKVCIACSLSYLVVSLIVYSIYAYYLALLIGYIGPITSYQFLSNPTSFLANFGKHKCSLYYLESGIGLVSYSG